jgi:hypothetical protein
MNKDNTIDEKLQKWAESYARRLDSFDPEGAITQQGYHVPDLVEVVATVSLSHSSKRLERLSWILIGLTAVLIVLTIVLVFRTFVPLAR